jgi:hypothetical protein
MNSSYTEDTSARAVMLKVVKNVMTEEEKFKKSKMNEPGEKRVDEEKKKTLIAIRY